MGCFGSCFKSSQRFALSAIFLVFLSASLAHGQAPLPEMTSGSMTANDPCAGEITGLRQQVGKMQLLLQRNGHSSTSKQSNSDSSKRSGRLYLRMSRAQPVRPSAGCGGRAAMHCDPYPRWHNSAGDRSSLCRIGGQFVLSASSSAVSTA